MITVPKTVHFVGICGTAMASAAAAMLEKGFIVTGSDNNVYPPMSTFLAGKGIQVMTGFREENLDHKPDLLVIGNAISRGNPEAEAALERKLSYCSLPELLKNYFIRGRKSLVVAGTHGKTTTTSLLTWVFEVNGLNPSYLIGGIPSNLKQGARFTDSQWFIIEGDEYDTSFFDKRSKFVHYLPHVAILNNLEFDHADIFEDLRQIQISFRRMLQLVPRNGLILANGDERALDYVLQGAPAPVKRFGFSESNEIRACNFVFSETGSQFQVGNDFYRLPLMGELNIRNALAVVSAASFCGLTPAQIQKGFSSFEGIRRRMEVRGEVNGVTVIDDFGHHPTAIRETLRALKIKYSGHRLISIFEPRSNTTRRNVFQNELVRAFDDSDMVIVSEVARLDQLKPEERLDAGRLMSDLQGQGKETAYLPSVDQIVDFVAAAVRPGDVVSVFSNGGFGGIHDKLLDRLRRNNSV